MIIDIYFELLGVTRSSSKKEIKKAHREQIKLWHPDKFSNDINKTKEATEKTQKLNEAYSFLKDYNLTDETQSSHKINRTRVKSSNVYSIGYDIKTKTLQVEFKSNRAIYEYYDVPLHVYEAFIRAESKGKFMAFIYHYKYQRIK